MNIISLMSHEFGGYQIELELWLVSYINYNYGGKVERALFLYLSAYFVTANQSETETETETVWKSVGFVDETGTRGEQGPTLLLLLIKVLKAR